MRQLTKSEVEMRDRLNARYDKEPWARLAREAGYDPFDTESSARDAFAFCADRIAKLEAEVAEMKEGIRSGLYHGYELPD